MSVRQTQTMGIITRLTVVHCDQCIAGIFSINRTEIQHCSGHLLSGSSPCVSVTALVLFDNSALVVLYNNWLVGHGWWVVGGGGCLFISVRPAVCLVSSMFRMIMYHLLSKYCVEFNKKKYHSCLDFTASCQDR